MDGFIDGWMDGWMDVWMHKYKYRYIYIWCQMATDDAGTTISSAPNMQQRYMPSRCHQVPCMPRETKVDVSKCHACHAKSRGVHGDMWEPSAPPEPAQCHTCHACHVKRRWMSQSATPATQSAATCLQVPRLPRKCSYMSPSATPVTQKAAATKATAENRARQQSQPSAIRATPIRATPAT